MTELPFDTVTARPRTASWLTWAGIVVGSAILVWVWLGLGVRSLPGLALLAAGLTCLVILKPGWLLVITPTLMFVPGRQTVFPYEIALGLLLFVVILHGLRLRAGWLTTLDVVERANLVFVFYATLSVFWSGDVHFFLHGLRRLLNGVVAFWVAYRVARFVPRRTFELGLISAAYALSGSALAQNVHTTGFGQKQVSRGEATDLGWGKANYIATILLVLGAPALTVALRARQGTMRLYAWGCCVLNLLMQVMIASRAATILFFGGLYAQLTGGRRSRERWLVAVLIAALVAGVVWSPSGQKLISRFTDMRELGGMTVRIWYWRQAWLRTKEGFPFGIGLNQGYIHADKLGSMGTHDYWLDLSSELGVPGVLLWIVVLMVLWRRACVIARTPGWEWEGRALQVAFWLNQLHTLVEPTFQGGHVHFVFFWVMGGYSGYYAVAMAGRRESGASAGTPPALTAG